MNTICIMCPIGCPLKIEEKDGEVIVSGNTCKRGQIYGVEEYTHPRRSVTTLVRLENGEVASVKTSASVPKERVFDVVNYVGTLCPCAGVKIGDVIDRDVFGLGVDIIVTGIR